mgnify:CR=1 FL=1
MNAAPLHPQETERMNALKSLDILDTPPEKAYDELVELAASIFDVPIALISLIDSNRQWFKAKVGLDVCETSREVAFCAHCILKADILEVSDASLDERFKDNPLVTEFPHIRFYAGAPLYSSDGLPLGSLCIISSSPRKLTSQEHTTLVILAKQVSHQLELRRTNKQLATQTEALTQTNQSLQELFRIISHDLRSPFQGFLGITELIEESYDSFTAKDIRSYIAMLGSSASETFNLLENLLGWSNLEQGMLKFTPETQFAAKIVSQSIHILSNAIRKKQIQLINAIPNDIVIKADLNMINSVIRNLVNNAIKFTPNNGSIQIDGTVHDGYLKISITDSGNGLTPEQIDKILHSRTVTTTLGTEGERGSGIGLHLVHNFLAQHNTQLQIESILQKGTTASFDIPLA